MRNRYKHPLLLRGLSPPRLLPVSPAFARATNNFRPFVSENATATAETEKSPLAPGGKRIFSPAVSLSLILSLSLRAFHFCSMPTLPSGAARVLRNRRSRTFSSAIRAASNSNNNKRKTLPVITCFSIRLGGSRSPSRPPEFPIPTSRVLDWFPLDSPTRGHASPRRRLVKIQLFHSNSLWTPLARTGRQKRTLSTYQLLVY